MKLQMDVTAIRWETLLLVLALAALAVWALADTSRDEARSHEPESQGQSLMLEIRRPGAGSEVIRVTDGTVLGRSPQCHVIFNDPTVSKQHARLRIDGGRALVEDLHSTNGTLVNGKAIEGPTTLRRGDRIGLGPNLIVLLGESSPSPSRERL